jgi:non-specific serine/threonine protein kinase
MIGSALTLALTPHGHLVLLPSPDAPALPPELQRRLEHSFERGAAHGLLDLGLREVGTALPPLFAFWRDFGARYVTTLCTSAEASATDQALRTIAVPSQEELDGLVAAAPPMSGGEYLTAELLEALWAQVDSACRTGGPSRSSHCRTI